MSSADGTKILGISCASHLFSLFFFFFLPASAVPELHLEELLTNFELFSIFAEFLHEHLSHEVHHCSEIALCKGISRSDMLFH